MIRYLLMMGTAFSLAAAELVVNGDFESGGPEPWKSPQRGNREPYTISTETATGKYCIRGGGDPQNKYNSFLTLIQKLPQLDKDGEYVFSVRTRAAAEPGDGKSFRVAIRQANEQKAGLGYTGFTVNLAEDGWRYHEMRFKPDRRAVEFVMYLIAANLNDGEAVYVDDVSLRPAGESGKPFDPAEKAPVQPEKILEGNGVKAAVGKNDGLLTLLELDGQAIHPRAGNTTVVFVQRDGREFRLDGKGSVLPGVPFRAGAEYGIHGRLLRETVEIEALEDAEGPFKLGIRHGYLPARWTNAVHALRPLRVIPAARPTVYSYRRQENDLNLGQLDQYQSVSYPMAILENSDFYLLAGSLDMDRFVTAAPNQPQGYFPSFECNPVRVKKGEKFRFEINWGLFPRSTFRLRDVWRFYCDNLRTNDPALAGFIPPRYTEPRTFYPGTFGSHTYFEESREQRLAPGSNIWFYSWHDNIHERYPVSGDWWSAGNSWKEKISAGQLQKEVKRLQDRDFKLIFYFRSLANLNLRGKGLPEEWFRKTSGGALHLYGGGYQVKLPGHVASEAGYDSIPLGHYDFSNSAYREFYLKELFTALEFYRPAAIGWDMGSDIHEFLAIAEVYDRLRQAGGKVKVAANESGGPTQPYADMVLLENGLLGGKTSYDFEIARAYTTGVACLERFNLFQLAVEANLTGRRTWLADAGLAANKRYLEPLLARRPELSGNIRESGRLCQLRASLYDLSLGASPGYLEEAAPVPESLIKFAGDVNGILKVDQSFVLRLPNNEDVDGPVAVSAWAGEKQFRLAAFNDSAHEQNLAVRLQCAYFEERGWNNLRPDHSVLVDPEQERSADARFVRKGPDWVLEYRLPPFTALLLTQDKQQEGSK